MSCMGEFIMYPNQGNVWCWPPLTIWLPPTHPVTGNELYTCKVWFSCHIQLYVTLQPDPVCDVRPGSRDQQQIRSDSEHPLWVIHVHNDMYAQNARTHVRVLHTFFLCTVHVYICKCMEITACVLLYNWFYYTFNTHIYTHILYIYTYMYILYIYTTRCVWGIG